MYPKTSIMLSMIQVSSTKFWSSGLSIFQVTIQHCHESLNQNVWKSIQPEDVSRIRCDTVATRKIVGPEDQN